MRDVKSVLIYVSLVILVALARADAKKGSMRITGPARVVIRCPANHTTQARPKECPEGFFMTEGSTQCFKLFNDRSLSWEQAKGRCNAEGLHLAEPSSDAVAIALRKDVIDRYGSDSRAWIGGRGDGVSIKWDRSGEEISNDSPLFWLDHPSKSSCLRLLAFDRDMERYPGRVYGAGSEEDCSNYYHMLCELVV